MINDETQDQDLQEEQKAMPADAKALLDKVHTNVPAPPPGDEWVTEAVKAVEASITKLIDEFREQPFIHRVEHSLHARLMQLLSEWEHLRGWYPIDNSGFKTQLIHKEWPETRPRKKEEPELIVDRRRGSFDVVILAPSQLEKATLEQFTVGRIDAPIVIELGLGYWNDNLRGDRDKLTNSQVQHPYLVHLSRMPSGYQEETEVIIAGIEAPSQIAYVHHDLEQKKVYVRYLGSPEIAQIEHSRR
jgi:hypothetical protein